MWSLAATARSVTPAPTTTNTLPEWPQLHCVRKWLRTCATQTHRTLHSRCPWQISMSVSPTLANNRKWLRATTQSGGFKALKAFFFKIFLFSYTDWFNHGTSTQFKTSRYLYKSVEQVRWNMNTRSLYCCQFSLCHKGSKVLLYRAAAMNHFCWLLSLLVVWFIKW